jgi:hypothetical protein
VAERGGRYEEARVVEALQALARYVEYPPAPDLAAAVTDRVIHRGSPARHTRVLPAAAFVAAVVLVAAIVAVLASPAARNAIADRLGLGGIRIYRLPAAPTVPVTPATTASPGELLGAGFVTGTPVPLEEARRRVAFTVAFPPPAGEPDAVYVDSSMPGGQVTMLWRAREGLPETTIPGAGLLLQQFNGLSSEGFYGKGVGPGTTIASVVIDGRPGFWIAGEPHVLFFEDANGIRQEHPLRLAGNTLIWVRGTVTFRLESGLSKRAAERLAESIP